MTCYEERDHKVQNKILQRYFPSTLQLNYEQSKSVRIFWIRPLERITLKLLINVKTGKSIFGASVSFPRDMLHIEAFRARVE